MTIHACLLRTGKSVVRRLSVLLAAVLILSGCAEQRLFAVKAVAAGIPSLAPFFEEDGSLGRDKRNVRPEQPHSGLQQGNTPGLYGGTRHQRVCDVDRLKDFLTDPRNEQKAREWARIVDITPGRIEGYVDSLTAVLLRHDTLVKNHDYKKGSAVPYDALLEAGIAVLVNDRGLPAVKCSCGNPLRAFDRDPGRISVEFQGGNEKWDGYEKSDVVTVKPSPRPLERIALLDVEDRDRAITRPVGTTGEQDSIFDATKRRAVPPVVGTTFDEAGQALAEVGLAVTYAGDGLPPGDAPVTGVTPGPGTPLAFGKAVALSVDPASRSGGGATPSSPSGTKSPPGTRTPSGTESAPGKGTPSDKETGPGSGTPTGTGPAPGGGTPSGQGSTPGGGTASGTESSPDDGTPAETASKPAPKPPPSPDPPPTAVSSTPPTAGPTSAAPTSTGPAPVEPTRGDPASGEPATPGAPDTGASGIEASDTGEAAQSPAQAHTEQNPGVTGCHQDHHSRESAASSAAAISC
ncbi:PASTA domain-containing protein [Streptomyces sp. Qhu-G9]|uniref:DUF6777 domain-containing protein n=1 Tax=Streptomyces sp. Qhu-G9 TaxID=3452799 RepID=UPI0022ABD374|nr:DUF6777 domain-containing protein [Streptomyces aurantiacus]WAU81228.1 PASTA domain-containing protein [Streptomyces aurantiacus]